MIELNNKIDLHSGNTGEERHNVALLQGYQRGQRFIVKNGQLELLTSIKDKIRYFIHSKREDAKVKAEITRTLQVIGDNNTVQNKEAITKLFFETLRPLNREVYDRGSISRQIFEDVLFPELRDFERQYTEDKMHEYACKTERVRAAVKLGVDFEPTSGGVSGSYYGLDRHGKKMVVFKPTDEEGLANQSPKFSSRIIKFLTKICPSGNPLRNINVEKASYNEAAASRVDEYLGFDTVPTTRMDIFESDIFNGDKRKSGSCQLFASGSELASRAYQLPKPIKATLQKPWMKLRKRHLPNLNIKNFEEFVILDYLIGNQDRHLDNYLVNKKTCRIVAIDNGYTFPSNKPQGLLERANLHTWAYLPEAQTPFSDEMRQKVKEKLQNRDQLVAIINEELSKDEDGEGLTEGQISDLNRRIDILLQIMDEENSSPITLKQKDKLC